MEFWIVFLVIILLIHSVQLHIRAGKRIRVLEENLLTTQQQLGRHLNASIELSEAMKKLVDMTYDHERELFALRIKEKSHESSKEL